MSRPLEWCTTEGRRRRHLSDYLVPARHAPRIGGRSGPTLCGRAGRDEERVNAARKVYDDDGLTWAMVPPSRVVVVADLPECRSCLRCAEAFNRSLPDPSAVGGEPKATPPTASDLGGES